MKIFLAAKIHGIVATDKHLHYTGSVTIDRTIMEAVGIEPFERVQVVNLTNGERWETYAVEGTAGGHDFVLNGGSARLGEVGDTFLVMTYELGETPKPRIAVMGSGNRIERVIDLSVTPAAEEAEIVGEG